MKLVSRVTFCDGHEFYLDGRAFEVSRYPLFFFFFFFSNGTINPFYTSFDAFADILILHKKASR